MHGKILLIVHQEHSNPGRVGRLLEEFGFELVLCRHACGDALPTTLEDYAGAVIFGGPMSANDGDRLPFIRAELDWLEVPLGEDKPFLGICLGAQLLAHRLGGRVGPHPDGYHEVGYYRVRATAKGRALFAPEQWFYQWHGEGFELPPGAELLAEGGYFRNQAFRYGNAYGIQFHPEVTAEMMVRWAEKPVHRMVLRGAQSRDRHMDGHGRHDGQVEQWLDRFLRAWLAPVREHEAGVAAAQQAVGAD